MLISSARRRSARVVEMALVTVEVAALLQSLDQRLARNVRGLQARKQLAARIERLAVATLVVQQQDPIVLQRDVELFDALLHARRSSIARSMCLRAFSVSPSSQ